MIRTSPSFLSPCNIIHCGCIFTPLSLPSLTISHLIRRLSVYRPSPFPFFLAFIVIRTYIASLFPPLRHMDFVVDIMVF